MALTINGTIIEDGDPLTIGGVQAEKVTVNGVTVWEDSLPVTELYITWTILEGDTAISIGGADMQYSNNGGSSFVTLAAGTPTITVGAGPYILKGFPTSLNFVTNSWLYSGALTATGGGSLTTGNSMFKSTDFTSIDASGLDTRNMTSMYRMFSGLDDVTSINVSGWNSSKVGSFYQMFYSCDLLTSLDLSSFDFSSATSTKYMFYSCGDLVCLTNIDTTAPGLDNALMFNNCVSLVAPNSTDQSTIENAGMNWVNPGSCP